MQRPRILFSEKDDNLHRELKRSLFYHGFEVLEASENIQILQSIQKYRPDLIIIGSSQNGKGNRLHIIEQIRLKDETLPIIIISKQSSEAQVLAALKMGVNDYFTLPLSPEEFITSVQRNLAESLTQYPVNNMILPDNLKHVRSMIGQSALMRRIKAYLLKVAETDCTVLITGETGTGKELAAETIHRYSARREKPFICINCAALPENLIESELFGYDKGAFTGAHASKQGGFELANGGIIFLDEIGDMSPCAQAKILRSIESKAINHLGGKKSIPLDVRIIAATNHEPERLLQEGRFREDLFYRLNVARIHLPPLREHKEDISSLIHWYLQEFNHQFGKTVTGFTQEALDLLMLYDWPGNIRELKNLLEATFINLPCEKISIANLPEPFRKHLKETEELPQNEREQLLSALIATNWNKSKAAQRLNWSRMTLYRKMAKYHIS